MATQYIPALSFGAFKRLLDGETLDSITLQILGYKEIPGSNNTRFRLLLNDGVVLFPYAILATTLNHLIFDNCLEKYTILRLNDYAFSQLIANKKVIICLDIEVLVPGSDVKYKISEKDVTSSREALLFNDSNVISTSFHCYPPVNVDPHASTSDIAQNWDTAQSDSNVLTNKKNDHACINPISSLTPYRNKWTIKARVSYKTPFIKYTNTQSQGKFFSFYLLDESGEIKATAFNSIAENFYDLLEVFKIYFISNANVKRAQRNSLTPSEFEIVIESYTIIEPYAGLLSTIPMPVFNFQTINQIHFLPVDSVIDVIGICHEISDVDNITTKSNKIVLKRKISLTDNSNKSMTVTLWDANAENFPSSANSVIAIKNAKITNYRGLSLNTSIISRIYIDPKLDRALELKFWFETFKSVTFQIESPSVSHQEASQNWKTIADVFTQINNAPDRPMYYTVKATIVSVKKEKCLYQACPTAGCLKKVIDLGNGLFKCNKCDYNYDKYIWSLCLSLEVADFTGSYWVTAFRETAEYLLNMGCDELDKIKSENEEKYFDVLNNLNLKTYAFKMRSQNETFNDNVYLKTTLLNFSPVEPILYTKILLTGIKKFGQILNNLS